ncbi:glycoside hydrolase family 27 protein [Edaphobacter sp.]|uniref:glycoside hydrolase family 27 protein n=1 Tax=Edaphobacter sp. TaxID=1934404 RepID=UPI002DBC1CC9|nr:glycoside hydrolase family 27 protein [Edaphobacter sp.]HEU5342483.1 glycoside hydrolase family 27 protein [Edaphobacter sp.]
MAMKRFLVMMAAVMMASTGGAQSKVLAPTPPMGWNSWDSYGLTVTERQFRDNVEVLDKKLKPFGWNYAVIDEGWFMENPQDRPHPERLRMDVDRYGRYIPVPARFPSAQDRSFKGLADWVHSMGMKFGIHIVRGIPRQSVAGNLPIEGSTFKAVDAADQTDACSWDPTNWGVRNNAAGQAWYDSLMRQYAEWGVDFVKVDCIASHPYKIDEIRMIHRAIAKTGRPMVLSLSPGPTALANAAEVGTEAQMWRISDDFWDYWASPTGKDFPQSVLGQFEKTAAWERYAKPGNWPDADMLPLGYLGPVPGYGHERETRLTHDEQRTLMTLWSMARSPLILGANLTKLDAFTTSLLTNPDVIAIDQHSVENRMALHEGDIVAWTARAAGSSAHGTEYLALFNVGDASAQVNTAFAKYGLTGKKYTVRDVWEKKDLGVKTTVSTAIPPHGVVLLKLRLEGRPD